MDHASVMARWLLVFAEHDIKGRRNVLASFLVQNEITKLEHLKYAEHPQKWIGAQDINADELEVVWNLRHKTRKRSRRVGLQLNIVLVWRGMVAQ